MKFVVNKCFGGFGLSEKAVKFIKDEMGLDVDAYDYEDEEKRTAPELIKAVETLGEEANGRFANLKVVNIKDDFTDLYLDEYDGNESLLVVRNGKIEWH